MSRLKVVCCGIASHCGLGVTLFLGCRLRLYASAPSTGLSAREDERRPGGVSVWVHSFRALFESNAPSEGHRWYRLFQRHHFRCHIWSAADPVGRVAAFQDPNGMIGPGAPCIPYSAERPITGKAPRADLCSEHILGHFFRGLRDGYQLRPASGQKRWGQEKNASK
jgi:hypothetical protein